MSSYFKDLYDYDLVKKCCRCGSFSLKSNFRKKFKSKDGLDPRCRLCRIQYYDQSLTKVKEYHSDKRDQILMNQKFFYSENYDKIFARKKIYSKIS